VYVLEIEVCCTKCCDCLSTRNKIAPLVRPWSTMTMIELQLLFSGKLVIKSVVTMLNGHVAVVLIGESGGIVGWVLTFICWHVAQPSM
jgi:hypothetical protein